MTSIDNSILRTFVIFTRIIDNVFTKIEIYPHERNRPTQK